MTNQKMKMCWAQERNKAKSNNLQSTIHKKRNQETEKQKQWLKTGLKRRLVSPSSISRYWALRLSAYEMEKTFLHYTDYKESPSVNYDWCETFTSPLLSVGWGVVEVWKNLRENHDPNLIMVVHSCWRPPRTRVLSRNPEKSPIKMQKTLHFLCIIHRRLHHAQAEMTLIHKKREKIYEWKCKRNGLDAT